MDATARDAIENETAHQPEGTATNPTPSTASESSPTTESGSGTADQHDPDQGGIVPAYILDKIRETGDSLVQRMDPFYRRDRLVDWLNDYGLADNPLPLAEALISSGWIAGIAPRENR